MWWIVSIALAAVCNSAMDSLYQVHIGITIFPKSWCKECTSATAKRIVGWKLDPWHMFKSMMILCLLSAIPLYAISKRIQIDNGILDITLVILIGFIAWTWTFNLFYNHIWKD